MQLVVNLHQRVSEDTQSSAIEASQRRWWGLYTSDCNKTRVIAEIAQIRINNKIRRSYHLTQMDNASVGAIHFGVLYVFFFFSLFFSVIAPLVRSTKCRHQSPQWRIPSQVNCFTEEGLLDFRSCWLVFIHIVRYEGVLVVSSSSPRRKLLRSSWHQFRLAFAQCDWTGRNAVNGQ